MSAALRRSLAGVILLAVAVAVAVAGFWWWRHRTVSPAAGTSLSATQPAQSPLAVRLQISIGAPGDDAVATVRVFNAMARQPESIRAAAPVAADFAAAIFTLETEGAAGAAAAPLPSRVLRLPQPATMSLDAAATATTVLTVAAAALPLVGARVRARVDLGGNTLVSNWVEVVAAGAGVADQLAGRARAQLIREALDDVAQTAEALITAAPRDSRGYFYRGLVLERRGDRAGAIAAYRATLDRLSPGDEPPIGLYERIKRLSR